MTDVVVSAVEGVTRTWKQEAVKRREISKTDPIADTLEYCAGEIASRLKAVTVDHRLTVEQYAKREKVTPQTVRNWIRGGLLPAIESSKGYLISADSKRLKRTA
jgi:hypothetical protein